MNHKKVFIFIFVVVLIAFVYLVTLFMKYEENDNSYKFMSINKIFENDNYKMSISYPKFNDIKFNNIISNQVDLYESEFLELVNQNPNELGKFELITNYEYKFHDNIITIILKNTTYIFEGYNITTHIYNYDYKQAKTVNLSNFYDKSTLSNMKTKMDEIIDLKAANGDIDVLDVSKYKNIKLDDYDGFYITSDGINIILDDDTEIFINNESFTANSVFNPDNNNTKYIALTFDDGPQVNTTEKLLDGLKERGVNATFFVLGIQCERYPELLKKIYEYGNEIGNHSYDHKNFHTLNEDELSYQISKSNDIIKNIIGVTPSIIRPSYGIVNKKTIDSINMPIILWSVDTMDWSIKSSDRIHDNVVRKIKDGDIVLFHDLYNSSVNAALKIIDTLKNNGYEFVTVSELARIRGIELTQNKQYFSFRLN